MESGNDKVGKVDVGYEIPTWSNWSPLAKFYHPLQAGSIDGTDTEAHDRAVSRAMLAKYKPNKRVCGDPDKTLFVGKLSKDTCEDTVYKVFGKCGELVNCKLVRDVVTGFSRGYAFVEYKSDRDANKAWRELHNETIDGCTILVEYEAARTLKGWIPRRLGGGFGGKKESGQLRFGGRDRPFRRPIPSEQDRKQNNNYLRGSRDHETSRENYSYRDREREKRERDREMSRSTSRYRDRGDDGKKYRERDSERSRVSERSRDYERSRERGGERYKERGRHGESRHRERDGYQDKVKNSSETSEKAKDAYHKHEHQEVGIS
ncbi:U11/U12 small nuclear ribonucleoprotein 35 kDa protein-like [Montipora capricornis]|uniref:U11/U12 small nuclear ribonucleoprotein 35 kDa protein-like n=1 Tax=Montipora capricornis TaxID=246305 RepID=UPI0035F148F4